MVIYTDGSCSPNPGPGGYGIVILREGRVIKKFGGSKGITTNNRMEMMALYRALRNCPDSTEVCIYTDSLYVCKCFNWEWGRHKNIDLWNRIEKEVRRVRFITLQWVRGHNGDQYNEMADRLARRGTAKSKGDML